MFTHQVRQKITAAFNHAMDRQARIDNPELSELQRFEMALNVLIDEGLPQISENDLNHALGSAERGHFARLVKPARNGVMLTAEQAEHANQVVYSILDIFQDLGALNNEDGMISLTQTLEVLADLDKRAEVEKKFSK